MAIALVAAGERVPLATEGGGGVHITTPSTPTERTEVTQVPPRSEKPVKVPGEGAIAVAIQSAFIIGALAFLVGGGRALEQLWRRRDEPDHEDTVPPGKAPTRPDEIVDVLDEGIEALANGPVDDVVIGCWVRLEGAAAAAGVRRLASETPAELAGRVLGELHAPVGAVERLLVRYRTARFSDHRLDDGDRAVAIRSLEEIRAAIVGASG